MLGAFMKPVTTDSSLAWAGELTTVPAYMEDRFANNTMLFLGVEYASSSFRHSLYVEGGIKASLANAAFSGDTAEHSGRGKGAGTGKIMFGPREIYYRYKTDFTMLRAGFGTTRLGDHIMVNERVLGLTFWRTMNAFTLRAIGGSASSFARMADFCGTKRLTTLVDREKYDTAGDRFGETNVVGATLDWDMTGRSSSRTAAPDEEFVMTDEFEPAASKPSFSLENIGLIYVQEHSTLTDTQKYFPGAYLKAGLPFSSGLKAEALYQFVHGSRAMIYYGLFTKDHSWPNAAATAFHLGYLGRHSMDDGARFEASYSNLFKGEIMRLDAIDAPMAFTGIRHTFHGSIRFYAQLQYVKQMQFEKTSEVDVEMGMNLFKRIKAASIISHIKTESTNQESLVGKLELRFGF